MNRKVRMVSEIEYEKIKGKGTQVFRELTQGWVRQLLRKLKGSKHMTNKN